MRWRSMSQEQMTRFSLYFLAFVFVAGGLGIGWTDTCYARMGVCPGSLILGVAVFLGIILAIAVYYKAIP
jgi:hypothetical protein